MIQDNYDRILERIAKSAELEKEEVDRRVEAKRAKLAGLISKEGAAQVVATELGISFNNQTLKIDELLSGMKKINVLGKIIKIFPVRSFVHNGKEGKVANFLIADETSNVKVVLWDVNHISLIENGQVVEGSSIEITNGSMRDNEIHLGSFSDLKLSDATFENLKTERIIKEKNISMFRISDNVAVRAFIVQVFEPKFFNVCPECNSKAVFDGENFSCEKHGKVNAEKRALINLVLDDGTQTIRAVLFSGQIPNLGLTNLENQEELVKQRKSLLGKEMIFLGNVRNNKFFNEPELIIDEIREIDLSNLLEKLEK